MEIADLRKKILFTALILLIFRIGSAIPVPFLDASVMQAWMSNAGDGNLLGYIDVLTGGAFRTPRFSPCLSALTSPAPS